MKRSYVYFNLQRRVWSERQAGKVVAHPEYVVLKDARFLVGKAGQARVRAEGRKNVHAGISGVNVTDMVQPIRISAYSPDWRKVTYNPYRHDSFVLVGGEGSQHGQQPVTSAKWAIMVAQPGTTKYPLPPVVWAVNPE